MNEELKSRRIPTVSQQPPDSNGGLKSRYHHMMERLARLIYAVKIWRFALFLLPLGALAYWYYFRSAISSGIEIDVLVEVSKLIGDAVLISLIVGFTYEWLVRKEAEQKLSLIVAGQLNAHKADLLRDIPVSLVSAPEMLRQIMTPDQVDDILKSAIVARLGDETMGADLFDGLIAKALRSPETWKEFRSEATLIPFESTIGNNRHPSLYRIVIDIRYKTVLSRIKYLFVTANSTEAFLKLLEDPAYEYRWMVPQSDGLVIDNRTLFDLDYMTIDGVPLEVTSQHEGQQGFRILATSEELPDLLGSEVDVEYRIRTVVRKHGHVYSPSILYPTKGVGMELDFSRVDIAKVNTLARFVAARAPNIVRKPSPNSPHRVEVSLNDWAFPSSGVVFVWVLSEELEGAKGTGFGPKSGKIADEHYTDSFTLKDRYV